jgi:hypothetical protein
LGYGALEHFQWIKWVVVALMTGGLGAVLASDKNARGLIIAFIIVPIVASILISHWYRPIWLPRTLATTVPFLSIAIAIFVLRFIPKYLKRVSLAPKVKISLVFSLLSLLLFSTILQKINYAHPWNIRDASAFLQSVTDSGDTIYVVNERVFWGVGWYFIGPYSVNPLTTNYILTSPSGVTVLSRPAFPSDLNDAEGYLVHRPMDDVTLFQTKSDTSRWDFRSISVVLLQTDD